MRCSIPNCQLPALGDPEAQGRCILHAQIPNKDLGAFQDAIDGIIRRAQQENARCDFSSGYFPEGYHCEQLRGAFGQDCSFHEATFSGGAYFVEVTFKGDADFAEVKFRQKASFWKATFSKLADFRATTFKREVSFFETTFSGKAYFIGATFSKPTRFIETTLSGEVNFERATFSREADFISVHTEPKAIVFLSAVRFSKPELVKFHHLDLSRWSFIDTDLRRIDFHNVTWENTKRPSWFLGSRWALYDELHNADLQQSNDKERKEITAAVERLYRHLKQNFEDQRDYSRASDFYYGEMVMKRRQLSWPQQVPFWIYYFMSCYGESYGQAILVLLGMVLLFGSLFMFAGLADNDTHIVVQRTLTWEPSAWWETFKDLGKSLVYTAESMTLVHQPNITFAHFWGKLAELAASVLGILQISLFGLALKRRFKR